MWNKVSKNQNTYAIALFPVLFQASFYSLTSVNDFIIDILLGSPSGEVSVCVVVLTKLNLSLNYDFWVQTSKLLCSQIRRVACDQLYTLSQSDTSAYPDLQKPNLFLLKVVLTAQLPLWSPTSIMRGVNQRSDTLNTWFLVSFSSL